MDIMRENTLRQFENVVKKEKSKLKELLWKLTLKENEVKK